MNATTVVQDLVDMVSKNGNFLLDIGPRADGSIVEAEAANLREAGKWIHAHAESIFNTSYWFVTPEVAASNIRFTQTDDAFYILALSKPTNGTLFVEAPVPILDGDRITMVGPNNTTTLKWWKGFGGSLTIAFPQQYIGLDEHCWVFKVEYLA